MMSVGASYSSLPINSTVPVVTGTASVGSTLTTSNGTWAGSPPPTFTYQWQKNTTNISGATSSSYVAQFDDVGNTLRCVVTATNILGSASANSANTAAVALPAAGTSIAGGYFAGQISTAGNSIADFNLIVGPLSSAQSTLAWKTSNTSTSGTSSVIDGPTNSSNMNDSSHPAAQFCEGLSVGGFSDWYMPAQNELEICYYSLKPTTESNFTGNGANANAVPARVGNYTAGTPAQTSAAAFQSGSSQAFTGTSGSATSSYWSSTEFSTTNGNVQYFSYGRFYTEPKTNNRKVRAVRRIPV